MVHQQVLPDPACRCGPVMHLMALLVSGCPVPSGPQSPRRGQVTATVTSIWLLRHVTLVDTTCLNASQMFQSEPLLGGPWRKVTRKWFSSKRGVEPVSAPCR